MKKLLFAFLLLAGLPASGQTTYAFMPDPQICFNDANGVPLAGGFLTTFAAGTSTQLATFHLDTLGNLSPNPNPITLSAIGCAEVRLLPQAYKMQLTNSVGAQIWQIDQISDIGQLALTQAVLLNPVGAALQTIAGPLAVTMITVGGGTPLANSNQSGTGILCMTVNCQLTTPTINGIGVLNSPGTYIAVANSAVTGTTINTLTKFAAAIPSWQKRNDQTGSGSGSPQVATAFTTSLTNPSLIIVFASGPVGTFSVTDTAGNSYVDCGQGQVVYNASALGVQCFYAQNTHTTASNIISFASTGGGAMRVTAQEWTGAALSAPVDVTQNSGGNASTGSGGGQNVSSLPATTTGADLVIGLAAVNTGILTVGTGFTAATHVGMEYQTQSGPGTVAATWNDNTNTDSYAALMVAFRPNPGSLSNAVIASTGDTNGVQGICVAGCGTSGTATIQESGTAQCVFDNATNANDYVQIGANGDCHDTGFSSSPSGAIQTIGRVLATNIAVGTYSVELFGPEFSGGGTTGTARVVCTNTATVTVTSNSLTTAQPLQVCKLPNPGSLNASGKVFRLTSYANIAPAGVFNSSVSLGVGASATLGIFGPIATSATSSGWNTGFTLTCMVTVPGTLGTLNCTEVASSTGSVAITQSVVLTSVNLTGILYVGYAATFATGNSANSASGQTMTVEQLN
jgi:hypothetical protein